MTLGISAATILIMNLDEWLKQPGNTQTRLAERMTAIGPRITQGAISQWLRKRVPAERVNQLCEATDGQIRPEDVRPDLFVSPQKRGAA